LMNRRWALVLLCLAACSRSGGLTAHSDAGRTWSEYRPVTRPAPLVILLHGYAEKPSDLVAKSGIETEARRDGFVVALPDDMDGWNAATCCGSAVTRGNNDVTFISGLIADMSRRGVIDPTRVYVVGFSNGGMLAYRIGCEMADRIAGVAVVDAAMTAPCPAHKPVDLLVIHQTGDTVVPYEGAATALTSLGDTAPFVRVDVSVSRWRDAEGCSAPASTVASPSDADPVQRTAYACAGANVAVDVLRGGSHVWPHGSGVTLDATSVIAVFFNLRR
jgi:polyhydroxybutyrate depolymerase